MTTIRETPPRTTKARGTSGVQSESIAIRDAILRDLTATERLLVVLRFAEGLTVHEIAEVLGRPTQEVERRIDRVIALLTGRASQAGATSATA